MIKISLATKRGKDVASMLQEIAEFVGNNKTQDFIDIDLTIRMKSMYGTQRTRRIIY